MTDYAAYIPVVNRQDLLNDVVDNAFDVWGDLTVIDNSVEGMRPAARTYRSPVPLSFTQSMNYEMVDAQLRNKKFCVHMHSDAVFPRGTISKLLEFAREVDAAGRRWGVIYTYYDVLAVYNPRAYEDIGGFDTNFAAYFSDNDWYHRLDLAGWERIESGIKVDHIGSQTVNSNPLLKHINEITFPLYRQYYVAKWGGEPGKEVYKRPFRAPLTWGKIG
jgi:hypothetical protein